MLVLKDSAGWAFAWAPFLVGDGFGVLKDADSQSMPMITRKWKNIQK